jgi:hypothetical protein
VETVEGENYQDKPRSRRATWASFQDTSAPGSIVLFTMAIAADKIIACSGLGSQFKE